MLAARQPPPAVAQAEQRVELLDELVRESPAAQRPDRDRVPGGRARRRPRGSGTGCRAGSGCSTSRSSRASQADVAGRAQLLDQAVLEHQRAELRARRSVVDDRRRARSSRPARVDGAKCARARLRIETDLPTYSVAPAASRNRYTPGSRGSSAKSSCGRRGERRRVRAAPTAAAAGAGAAAAAAPARRAIVDRVRAQPREQRAQDPRARLRIGQRAVRDVDLDPERVGERAEPALGAGAAAASRASAAVHSTGGFGHSRPIRSNAWRSTRRSNGALWATITRPRRRSLERRQHRLEARARRRPSPG